MEEKKKKRAAEFLKAVVAHRDEFVRFHKNKRGGEFKFGCLLACLHKCVIVMFCSSP